MTTPSDQTYPAFTAGDEVKRHTMTFATPAPSVEIDAAWEGLLDAVWVATEEATFRGPMRDIIARHRPIIEAAIRGAAPALDRQDVYDALPKDADDTLYELADRIYDHLAAALREAPDREGET